MDAYDQVCAVTVQVKGKQNACKLVQTLQPSVVVPLINAEFRQSGPLSMLIHAEGAPTDLYDQLQQKGMGQVTVRMPESPGKAFNINL